MTISADKTEIVIKMLHSGIRRRLIANECLISERTVYRIASRIKRKRRRYAGRPWGSIPKSMRNRIKELDETNLSTEQIARAVGLPKTTISAINR